MKQKTIWIAAAAGLISASAVAGHDKLLSWQGAPAETPAIARAVPMPAPTAAPRAAAPERASLVPVTLPWNVTLDNEEAFNLFEIIDANHDEVTWMYWTKDSRNYNVVYRTSPTREADDWLVTPPVPLKAGTNYKIQFHASGNSDYYTEKIEVNVGMYPTETAMVQGTSLLGPTDLKSAVKEFTLNYTPTSDGNYFIGFHAISEADQDYMTIYDILVEEGAEDSAPAEATNLRVVADGSGELKTRMSFKAPALNVGGAALESLDKIEIMRDDALIATLTDVQPGKLCSYVDEDVTNGDHTYGVVAYAGGKKGRETKAEVFVGVDVPSRPEAMMIQDMGETIKASWPRVTTGANGRYFNPDKVTYRIYSFDAESKPTVFVAETTGTEYDIPVNTNEGEARLAQYAVAATTTGGEGEACYSNALLVGAPYGLPFLESFYDAATGQPALNKFWYFDGEGLGYSFGLSNVTFAPGSSDMDNSSLKFNTVGYNDVLNLTSGRVKITGQGNKLFFDYRTDGAPTSEFNLFAVMPDGNQLALKTYEIAEKCAWKQAVVELPAYLGAMDYIMVRFQLKATGSPALPQTLYIDNVNIMDASRRDLKVDVVLPEKVQKGKAATAKVMVHNRAGSDVESYSLTLTAGDKEIASRTVTEPLTAFTMRQFDFSIPTSAADDIDEITVRATVSCENDADQTNNAVTRALPVYPYSGPTVTALETAAENGSNVLSWNAPEIVNVNVEESFEDFTPFEADSFGDWRAFSNDEAYAGGLFEDLEMPHQYENYAFMVTNFEPDYQAGEYFPGHTGYAFLGAVYGLDDLANQVPTDKWLISPPLSGNAQTVTFWARNTPLDMEDKPENVAVGYSVSGSEMEDFTWLTSKELRGGQWTEISVQLPEGATYFAIRTNEPEATGFWLLLDDFKFETGPGAVDRYLVYCNGEKIGETETTSFTDPAPRAKTDRYAVTTLFVNGNESAPAYIYADGTSGVIGIEDAAALSADVYNLQGVCVRRNADIEALRSLPAGVYVVAGRKLVLK